VLVIGLLAALDVVGVGNQGEHAQLSGGALLEVVVRAATAEDRGPAAHVSRGLTVRVEDDQPGLADAGWG
jgi:hypothetical protein